MGEKGLRCKTWRFEALVLQSKYKYQPPIYCCRLGVPTAGDTSFVWRNAPSSRGSNLVLLCMYWVSAKATKLVTVCKTNKKFGRLFNHQSEQIKKKFCRKHHVKMWNNLADSAISVETRTHILSPNSSTWGLDLTHSGFQCLLAEETICYFGEVHGFFYQEVHPAAEESFLKHFWSKLVCS